MTLTPGHEKD